MKLDKSTTPPRAWKVEDGEVIYLDQKMVKRCPVCGDWFIDSSIEGRDNHCSTGCKLRRLESVPDKT